MNENPGWRWFGGAGMSLPQHTYKSFHETYIRTPITATCLNNFAVKFNQICHHNLKTFVI